MGLDFGMSNMFPQSGAEGDGMRANVIQRRRLEGGKDTTTLLWANNGITYSIPLVELDKFVIPKGSLLADEEIYIECGFEGDGAGTTSFKINIEDSAGTASLGVFSVSTSRIYQVQVYISQRKSNDTDLVTEAVVVEANTITDKSATLLLTDKNIITKKLIISITADGPVAPTGAEWGWRIYRRNYI